MTDVLHPFEEAAKVGHPFFGTFPKMECHMAFKKSIAFRGKVLNNGHRSVLSSPFSKIFQLIGDILPILDRMFLSFPSLTKGHLHLQTAFTNRIRKKDPLSFSVFSRMMKSSLK